MFFVADGSLGRVVGEYREKRDQVNSWGHDYQRICCFRKTFRIATLLCVKGKAREMHWKFWGNHQCSKSCLLKKSVGYQSVCGVLICDDGAESPLMECGIQWLVFGASTWDGDCMKICLVFEFDTGITIVKFMVNQFTLHVEEITQYFTNCTLLE